MPTPRFLHPSERTQLEGVVALVESNPFLPERVEAERRVLGAEFRPRTIAWHADATLDGVNPNLAPTAEVAERLAPRLRDRLLAGARANEEELSLYESLVLYLLYSRYETELWKLIERTLREERVGRIAFWERFEADVERFLGLPRVAEALAPDPAHLFAWGFQVRRAFHFTFRQIYGGSLPAAKLRAAVWESVFTADRRRYRRSLWRRMGDVTTLVLGESGTGKELVARAIALSRYVPFDDGSRSFRGEASFHPVNLSALSPTLVESELFGHRRGAFTGALEDRAGYLESCPAPGAVFLDEIGELAGELQVKLLRVLQERAFQRIGESRERRFEGKVIAATNRDLEAEMRGGRFRADLYY
ncbi:MAG: sigma-54 factor interaction domain-containing protein, partial [Candidatus Binatia bacterium]